MSFGMSDAVKKLGSLCYCHLRSSASAICSDWQSGTLFHVPGLQLGNEVSQSMDQPQSPELSESGFNRTLKTHLFSSAQPYMRRFHDSGAGYKYLK